MHRLLALVAAAACFGAGWAHAQNSGNVDPALDPGTGPSNPIYALAVQPDGKIVIGGNFYYLGGYTVNGFARLNGDGSIDFSFNPGTGANGPIHAVALQANGQVLIGGDFSAIQGFPRNGLARLNADGSVDQSFGSYAGANALVRAIAVQPDGQILVGGDFTFYNHYPLNGLARLNRFDGSLDFNFNPGSAATAAVGTIAVQGDGQILVGGNFLGFNGYNTGGLVRLSAYGAVDTTFGGSNPPFPNNYVTAIQLQADGKILAGGGFTAIGGAARNAIARLNVDGTVDAGFADPAGGPDGAVLALGIQPDGRIIIAGEFTSVDGIQGGSIARLAPDGTLDLTYGPGFPANGAVTAVQLLTNGATVAGGAFTSIGGQPRAFLARLLADPSANPAGGQYLRLLSLNDKEFSAGAPIALFAEAYSPADPVASVEFFNNDTSLGKTAAAGPMPIARRAGAPARQEQALPQQVFQSLANALAQGLNNLRAVATTQSGAKLSSNTSGITGASAAESLAVQITSPAPGNLPAAGTPVQVAVNHAAHPVTVEFYVDSAKGGLNQIQAANASTSTFSLAALSRGRPHYLTAVVTDNVTKISRQSAPVQLAATLPTVTVAPKGAGTVTEGAGKGKFAVTRDGDLSTDLTVFYKAKGSAGNGVGYEALPGSVVIPAGSATAKIKVRPVDDHTPEGTRTAVIKLLPDTGYNIGTPKKATVLIFDNE